MTEQEWLSSESPDKMLWHLNHVEAPTPFAARAREAPLISDRKLRLFACACAWRVRDLLREPHLEGLKVAERFADGDVTDEERRRAHNDAYPLIQGTPSTRYQWARAAASCCLHISVSEAPYLALKADDDKQGARTVQAHLLREIVGNPWKPANRYSPCEACHGKGTLTHRMGDGDPVEMYCKECLGAGKFDLWKDWLSWNGGAARNMAEVIYKERAWDRMPILADALEDGGCDCGGLLAHLRGGHHVRGCWVVDLLTGRE